MNTIIKVVISSPGYGWHEQATWIDIRQYDRRFVWQVTGLRYSLMINTSSIIFNDYYCVVQSCVCILAYLWGSHGWYGLGTIFLWQPMPPTKVFNSTSYLAMLGLKGKASDVKFSLPFYYYISIVSMKNVRSNMVIKMLDQTCLSLCTRQLLTWNLINAIIEW